MKISYSTSFDWKSYAIQKLIFPLHEKLKKHDTVKVHRQLMRSQWDPHEIKLLQQQHFANFLQEVTHHVPFFKQFKKIPFALWPLQSKDSMRRDYPKYLHSMAKNLQKKTTSGSTGEPFDFFVSKERITHDIAAKWRATRWWGVDIGDPELVIWGSAQESQLQTSIKTLRDCMLRSKFIDARDLDEKKALTILEAMIKKPPKMLFGYPSILAYVAQVGEKYHYDLSQQRIKVAFVTSELLEESQKNAIVKLFNCQVANGYGGRDIGFVAHSCPAHNLHISAEDILVEIVDEEGKRLPNGKIGEIVITHLQSRYFPFVRYKTGDRGALLDTLCSCGRKLPLLDKLEGRQSDLIYNSSGKIIHRSRIFQIINEIGNISKFKFQQNSLHDFSLWLVSTHQNENMRLHIERAFQKLLGTVKMDVQFVTSIAPEKNGKYRFVVSKLNTENFSTTSLKTSREEHKLIHTGNKAVEIANR